MDKSISVVITGASRGLGASISKIIGSLGNNVFLTARNEEKLESITDEINTQGGNAKWLAGDLTDFEFCKQLGENVLTEFGKINVLINNAGTVKPLASFA